MPKPQTHSVELNGEREWFLATFTTASVELSKVVGEEADGQPKFRKSIRMSRRMFAELLAGAKQAGWC